MSKKFHINHNGEVKECKAYKQKCKYGRHFINYNEAQKFVELKLNSEFELLPNVIKNKKGTNQKLETLRRLSNLLHGVEKNNNKKEFKKREKLLDIALDIRESIPEITWYSKKADKKEMYKVKSKHMRFISYKDSYYNRMKFCNRINNLNLDTQETYHYEIERKDKRDKMNEAFDKGETIAYYKINHTLEKDKFLNDEPVEYCRQIIEVRDNGRCIVYDEEGNTVTTFIANDSRIDAYMTKAGEIPNQDFLNNIKVNKLIAVLLEIEK